jgi:D-alanyl-D-alanine carboxypeptidase/D-alanyl-D-alanine-endopeptidase (penicillin-binding protein 4)
MPIKLRHFASILLLLAAAGPVRGQAFELHLQKLQQRATAGLELGFYARDITNPSLPALAEIYEHKRRIPASNMKLITTAAALAILPPGFEFSTKLLLDPKTRTLYLIGDGDPAFGDPVMLKDRFDLQQAQKKTKGGIEDVNDLIDAWAREIRVKAKQAGLKKIDRIVIQDSVLDWRQRVHPQWPKDQLTRWYCAQVASINFNNNCLDIYVEPPVEGTTAIIHTLPSRSPIQLTNRVKLSSKNAVWVSRQSGTNQIGLHGTIRRALTARVQVTIDDPSMFFGRLLQRWIESQRDTSTPDLPDGARLPSIPVESVVRIGETESVPDKLTLVIESKSPLAEVLHRCNRDSQNLFAEAMFRRLGHQVTSEPGTWSNGSAAVRMFLSRALRSKAADIVVDDGSGMSRRNRVSPASLVRILEYMRGRADPRDKAASDRHRTLWPIYRDSLARPGETRGTLRRRFQKGMAIEGFPGSIRRQGEAGVTPLKIVKVSTANLRTEPKNSAKIITKLKRNDTVRILESKGSWQHVESLPAGQRGWVYAPSLTDLYILRGTLRAKTGYIRGVVALSGYLTHGKRTIAFSMLINDFKGSSTAAKAMIDQTILRLDKKLYNDEADEMFTEAFNMLETAKAAATASEKAMNYKKANDALRHIEAMYPGSVAQQHATNQLALIPK